MKIFKKREEELPSRQTKQMPKPTQRATKKEEKIIFIELPKADERLSPRNLGILYEGKKLEEILVDHNLPIIIERNKNYVYAGFSMGEKFIYVFYPYS